MPQPARRKGFSLTDLTVAILVIAILVAILVPAISKAYQSTRRNRIAADLSAIVTAIEAFRQDTGSYPEVANGDEDTERGAKSLFTSLMGNYKTDGSFTAGFRNNRGRVYGPYLSLDHVTTVDGQNGGKIIVDLNGNPILYYPAKPGRRDLTIAAAYVGNFHPTTGTGAAPLFNAYDNLTYMPEETLRSLLGAEETGAMRVSTSDQKQQLGAYVLISAGPDGIFGTADDVVQGGGQAIQASVPLSTREFDAYAHGNMQNPPPPPPQTNGLPPGPARELPERHPTQPPADALDVTDFGAVAGDGIDDTAAIQAAINAAGDGAVVIPEGVFDVNGTLKLVSGGSYYGPGTLNVTGPSKFAMIADQKTNVTIDGITFNGAGIKAEGATSGFTVVNSTFQNIHGGGAFNDAIFAGTGLKNATIVDNNFVNVAGNGVWATGMSTETIIARNHFDTVWEGVHIWTDGGQNIQISDNTAVNFKRMGVEFQGTNHNGVRVENNVFTDWSQDRYHESFGLSIVNWGTNGVVRNNVMASGANGAIDPRAKDAPVGIEIMGTGTTVEGNKVYGFREGMHVGPSTTNSVVKNNTFDNQADMAIWHTGLSGGSGSRNVTVTENTIITPRGASAILVTGGGFDGTKIYGNTVTLAGNTSLIRGGEKVTVGANSITRQ